MRLRIRRGLGRVCCCLVLLAGASIARGAVIFNDDIQGFCFGDTGAIVNGGHGFSLWGNCSFTDTDGGDSAVYMHWSGSTAPGSALAPGETFPFGLDFSYEAPSGKAIFWNVSVRFGQDPIEEALNHFDYAGGTTGSGHVLMNSNQGDWISDEPTIWDVSLWVTMFSVDPGSTLTVAIPQRSSIDFNNPASDVPEPSTVLFLITGLGGMTLCRKLRPRVRPY